MHNAAIPPVRSLHQHKKSLWKGKWGTSQPSPQIVDYWVTLRGASSGVLGSSWHPSRQQRNMPGKSSGDAERAFKARLGGCWKLIYSGSLMQNNYHTDFQSRWQCCEQCLAMVAKVCFILRMVLLASSGEISAGVAGRKKAPGQLRHWFLSCLATDSMLSWVRS
jgi:hypothetical protein